METTHAVYRRMPRQMIVAQEGFPFIAIALGGALVLWLTGLAWGAGFMLALAAFVAFFFRNPDRTPPEGSDRIVAPADGRILSVEQGVSAPHTGKPSTKVSIFMSVMNVHINRFPITARVKDAIYNPGKFFVASLDKASEQNERLALVLDAGSGREFVMVQIAGLVARRIVCYTKPGDTLDRGERFGLIRFGSRVDLYLPPDVGVDVRAGQRTRAGETVIGRVS
jgi:phosphatidylserine decarboxylase